MDWRAEQPEPIRNASLRPPALRERCHGRLRGRNSTRWKPTIPGAIAGPATRVCRRRDTASASRRSRAGSTSSRADRRPATRFRPPMRFSCLDAGIYESAKAPNDPFGPVLTLEKPSRGSWPLAAICVLTVASPDFPSCSVPPDNCHFAPRWGRQNPLPHHASGSAVSRSRPATGMALPSVSWRRTEPLGAVVLALGPGAWGRASFFALLTWAGLPPAGSRQLCLAHSFDHLVGASEHRRGYVEAEHLGHNVDSEHGRSDRLTPCRRYLPSPTASTTLAHLAASAA
jgi:hypothetical protein